MRAGAPQVLAPLEQTRAEREDAELGLYVVGKLAERHGIRVRLTESPYGGTTAIVLMPGTLMADDGVEDGRSGTLQVDGTNPAQLAGVGRHRLRNEPEPEPADHTGNDTSRAAGPHSPTTVQASVTSSIATSSMAGSSPARATSQPRSAAR